MASKVALTDTYLRAGRAWYKSEQACSAMTMQAKCLTFGPGLQSSNGVGHPVIAGKNAGQHCLEFNLPKLRLAPCIQYYYSFKIFPRF